MRLNFRRMIAGACVLVASTVFAPLSQAGAQTAPGAPTIASVDSRNAHVSFCWTPPASDGGAAISAYQLVGPGGATSSVSATQRCAEFPSANAQTVTLSVAATNMHGTGTAATVNAVAGPTGYYMLGAHGALYGFGELGNGTPISNPSESSGIGPTSAAVDIDLTPFGTGYWITHENGRVFAANNSLRDTNNPIQASYVDPQVYGEVTAAQLRTGERVTSLSPTRTGRGYWIFTSRGRVFPFGDARSFGDLAGVNLQGPVLDSVATPTDNGYYMVADDGGVFAFGDARFYGSMGGIRLNAPVMSLVPDRDNVGYWLVARDGGVFSFDAEFLGSMGATRLNKPVTGMVRHGSGYLMVAEDGGIFNFSNKPFFGSLGANPPSVPIVSVTSAG
ncbi:MAG: hypothetical protein ABWZ15_10820 [Acidimicrobiia bacterium]